MIEQSRFRWGKFFWSDWLSEHTLRDCSLAARGLAIDLICIMAWQSDRPGYLSHDGKPMTVDHIARRIGSDADDVKSRLTELVNRNGVFSVDDDGFVYSRRLVKDMHRREINTVNGKRGGNPKIKTHSLSEEESRSQKPEARGAVNRIGYPNLDTLAGCVSAVVTCRPEYAAALRPVDVEKILKPIRSAKRRWHMVEAWTVDHANAVEPFKSPLASLRKRVAAVCEAEGPAPWKDPNGCEVLK